MVGGMVSKQKYLSQKIKIRTGENQVKKSNNSKDRASTHIRSVRAQRGETLAKFVLVFNSREPVDIRITIASMFKYESGDIKVPAYKYLKIMDMVPKTDRRKIFFETNNV